MAWFSPLAPDIYQKQLLYVGISTDQLWADVIPPNLLGKIHENQNLGRRVPIFTFHTALGELIIFSSTPAHHCKS